MITHRFERYQNEIKNGDKLIVREGQAAVSVNEGQLAIHHHHHYLVYKPLPINHPLNFLKYAFAKAYSQAPKHPISKLNICYSLGRKRRLGADTQRMRRIDMKLAKETFKHSVLPAYVSACRYNGKEYNFYVNGETGAVSRARPYSFW